ncbi:MAG TPA: class I SAM-dependent methyltransferase [Xanthobacteraceae bacterium]|nr:class I SAM-dependent methyltransferase [Xanthobacteraceae bacterium]
MTTESGYSDLNEIKSDFSEIYTDRDPREYFRVLGQLDYIVPHVAQPVFDQLIRARAETQDEPVTVLDLGCSYGLNGALMKYALRYDALRERYTDPALKPLTSDALLALDRHFYQSWPKNPRVRVIGLDPSANAVRYGEAAGTMDLGLPLDLENNDPTPEQAKALEEVDLIVSTGCVGYVTSKTFKRLARLARRGRPAWVASFVLRMFPYDEIEETFATLGLQTERFESATFVQRRFANFEEMEATIKAVEALGLDPRGRESDGLFHAELFVSRPPEEIERRPLQKLVSVVSGANKPWPVGTHALGSLAWAARAERRRKLKLAAAS